MSSRTVFDIGTGTPTIVLVHGYCCHASDWQWHIDEFAKTNRVIAPSLRGHEDDGSTASDLAITGLAEDVADLLAQRDITDAVLIGHSMGQRVVFETNAIVPERVLGLVSIDGSDSVVGDLNEALSSFEAVNDHKMWVQRQFDQMFLPGSFLEEQAKYRARILNMPSENLQALYLGLLEWDANHLADRLTVAAQKPLLVLQSTIRENDSTRRSLQPGETGPFVDMLRQSHPNCTTITYPGLSHFPNLDAPEKIGGDILNWVTQSIVKTTESC